MTSATAAKLKEYIQIGDLSSIKVLLIDVNTVEDIHQLETEFDDLDPVNWAIDNDEEKIALFLVEKGFCCDRVCRTQHCDEWCYSNHGRDSKCPGSKDTLDNAICHGMHYLKEILENIRSNRGKAADAPFAPRPPVKGKPQHARNLLPKTVKEKPKSASIEAMSLLQRYGYKYTTKDGGTLLHRVANSSPTHVYVLANNGVPINVQNTDGNTALHLAARADNYNVCEALLQCCADLTLRNKMGQTPTEVAEGPIKKLLQKSELGVVGALLNGRSKLLARLLPSLWCQMHTVVKDGLNLLELGLSMSDDPNARNSLRILQEHRDISELIHAVLAEDEAKLHRVLSSSRGLSVNMRFRDRFGKTLLSHAIDSNNLEVVKVLVNAGARVNGVRVRDIGRSDKTVPLFHRSLHRDLQPEIAHFIHSVQDSNELKEKDYDGNTALLRAVEEGVSQSVIEWLLSLDGGMGLTNRNKCGLNARELAVSKGRSDIVQTIDKFVLQQRGKFFLVKLTVHFYGMDNLQFTDEGLGKTLFEVVEENGDKTDIKALRHQHDIEERAIKLFQASANGDLKQVTFHNVADFQDKNGLTALTRAIVFDQADIAEYLCTSRPVLKTIPDNNNRYPLHFACALPEHQGRKFITILLERNADQIEKKMDKDGLYPAEYSLHRESEWMRNMLHQARTLDAYGRESSPLTSSEP